MSKEAPSVGIEADAAAFADLLSREAGIPWPAIGISGSLLIGLHLDSSDLDISIFGEGSCTKVYEALGRLRNEPSSCVDRLDEWGLEELYRQRVAERIMPFDEFARREKEKICQGSFRRRPYFIRFIRESREVFRKYGDIRYTPLGRSTITATIVDDSEAIFTPCRYRISDLRILDGLRLPIGDIVSFRGRFCEQARLGEFVRVSGTVERVDDSILNETGHRLLLGNSPADTMQVVANNSSIKPSG